MRRLIQDIEGEYDSISTFAEIVQQAASKYFGEVPLYRKRTRDEFLASLGFHVCGYENGEIVFYNIHNNQGEPKASVNLNPASDKFRLRIAQDGHFHVRNGDWEPFGNYFRKFKEFGNEFAQKNRDGFEIPYPADDLQQWAKFFGFQVLLMSEIFQLSDLTPQFDKSSIGGEVNLLTMEPDAVIAGLQKLVVSDLGLKLEQVDQSQPSV